MARAEFDATELDRWTDCLMRVPAVTEVQARAVVSRGGLNMKTTARRLAPGGDTAPHYPASINYDVYRESQGWMAEMGPIQGRRQWGLGNLFEYGSAHNNPMPHLEPALDEEEPRFIAAAERLAGNVISSV
jgi:hypothetical protein